MAEKLLPKEEEGQSLVAYVLIFLIVAIVVIAVLLPISP